MFSLRHQLRKNKMGSIKQGLYGYSQWLTTDRDKRSSGVGLESYCSPLNYGHKVKIIITFTINITIIIEIIHLFTCWLNEIVGYFKGSTNLRTQQLNKIREKPWKKTLNWIYLKVINLNKENNTKQDKRKALKKNIKLNLLKSH